jgi:hypothetical protein
LSNTNKPSQAERLPRKGLKINNASSTVQKPIVHTQADLDQKASDVMAKDQEYKNRFWDLSKKIKAIFEDNTLSDNKGIISKDLEKETITKLLMLASEMDDDDSQPNCEGTRAVAMLLIKCLLSQRDSLNSLAYKVEKLEKESLK